MEVKSSSGMLIDDARGEMLGRGCFRVPWGGTLATVALPPVCLFDDHWDELKTRVGHSH
jgi:hypothetical protein